VYFAEWEDIALLLRVAGTYLAKLVEIVGEATWVTVTACRSVLGRGIDRSVDVDRIANRKVAFPRYESQRALCHRRNGSTRHDRFLGRQGE
jgi:hypothetical protein